MPQSLTFIVPFISGGDLFWGVEVLGDTWEEALGGLGINRTLPLLKGGFLERV